MVEVEVRHDVAISYVISHAITPIIKAAGVLMPPQRQMQLSGWPEVHHLEQV